MDNHPLRRIQHLDVGLEAMQNSMRKTAYCLFHIKDPFTKEDAYLILRKNHGGVWGIPGGGIELGESPQLAIMREIDEELHIDPKSVVIDPKHHERFVAEFSQGRGTRMVDLFSVDYMTPNIPPNISIIDNPKYPHPEHFEFRYVTRKLEIKHLPFVCDDIKAMISSLLK